MAELDIDARGLSKSFGDLKAVDGITLEISRGECYGLLGPNGAGKTTAIRMIHGATRRGGGELRVLGFDGTFESRRAREGMGIVSQEDTLDSELTVYDNMWVFANYFGIPRRRSRERIEELLDFVQLREKWGEQIKTLSGGMKRRLLIARALIHRPRLLILDEPTTGLDPQARHLVWQRLRELKSGGLTILLTTHYMEEAAQLCDRIGVMDQGHILVEGSPAALVNERVGEEVIELRGAGRERAVKALGEMSLDIESAGDTHYVYCRDGAEAARRLLAAGEEDFLRRPASLEDLFLRLTGRDLHE
ncbi:MAG: ATP-binding cassette domain-containing protein [Nitrospinaceae bacterium]|nr:ATP-binding cassette domain-containing protein [Nitrospinaceae bacterium]MBT3820041.1 ATP-binding cassette domain-containing protein [Nitrospinaceae bacterium]MBT4095303.1 ATP-binding cassette domain-containing protein [Nitrospinaceae bacterium]MBT5369456.1 ATP-binding cassette domain-containing protein [Nitrospinaceae bacterium]MBT5948753.1 ATP-binding cassette domain-containing protein [Nitrospinaceae bacterium]